MEGAVLEAPPYPPMLESAALNEPRNSRPSHAGPLPFWSYLE